jgi:hypothetical protein
VTTPLDMLAEMSSEPVVRQTGWWATFESWSPLASKDTRRREVRQNHTERTSVAAPSSARERWKKVDGFAPQWGNNLIQHNAIDTIGACSGAPTLQCQTDLDTTPVSIQTY